MRVIGLFSRRRGAKKLVAVDDGGAAAPLFTGREVTFTLPYPTTLLNPALRTHWAKLAQKKKRIAWDIKVLTHGARPPAPFARAHVRIERHSSGTPDRDGLIGGMKWLIDCLLPEGAPRTFIRGGRVNMIFPHPGGLAIIADDSPAVMTLDPVAVRVGRKEPAKTVVVIREIA